MWTKNVHLRNPQNVKVWRDVSLVLQKLNKLFDKPDSFLYFIYLYLKLELNLTFNVKL